MKIEISKSKKWKYATGLYEKGNNVCFLNRNCFAYDIGDKSILNIKADYGQEFVIGEGDECKLGLMLNKYLL